MKLFGIALGKDKAVPFPQFRDIVRAAVRRSAPDARMEPNDNGFNLTISGRPTISCNLRNLYKSYAADPGAQDSIIKTWIDSLVTDVPEQSWSDALMTLRPTLKASGYLAAVMKSMAKQKEPDTLPAEPFVGDLSVIVMREYMGTLTGVTQNQLNEWGVTLEQAMREALNNMSMQKFPHVSNTLVAGGVTGKQAMNQPEIGLVFEDNHITATWLISERFRDFVGKRLRSDYIVAVPNRNKLIAVRADEIGVIGSIVQANRNFQSQPYPLTGECFHVNSSTTGGLVTVYKMGANTGDRLSADSLFAAGNAGLPNLNSPVLNSASAPAPVRDLSTFWGLTEPTDDSVSTPPDKKAGR